MPKQKTIVMNKEQYLKERESLRNSISELNKQLSELRSDYIQANKPCEIGDNVKIVLNSGRVVKGEVVSFDILHDLKVCVTAYKEGNKTKYISVAYKSIEVI